MTVKDFLAMALEYQSFQLSILSFGKNEVLFSKYVNDSYFYEANKYADCKICAIKFGNDWVKLILDIGEENVHG